MANEIHHLSSASFSKTSDDPLALYSDEDKHKRAKDSNHAMTVVADRRVTSGAVHESLASASFHHV